MVTPIAVPGSKPGEVYIPALGRSFQQVELREDDVFDTEDIPSGSIAADTKFDLFTSAANKNEQHTSVTQDRRLPAGDEAAIFRVGFHPRGAGGNSLCTFNDIKKVVENGALEIKFNRRVITSGPLLKYQSGYGLAGSTVENNTSMATVGVASAAAAPTLFVPQQLTWNDDIVAKIFFPSAGWIASGFSYTVVSISTGMLVSIFMRAVIKAPLGK